MDKITFRILALLLALLPLPGAAQDFNSMDESGNITQGNQGNRNFNPHNNDTTKAKEIPKGIHVWTVDRHFGDIQAAEVDTMPHLFPQSLLGMGREGQYNTLGSNYTARLSRIFADRRSSTQSFFTDAYDQTVRQPETWHFTNTLSPITNMTYLSCGDKLDGEDLIDARFAVNAGKHTGIGFDLDYRYARGYFQHQNNSHFGATLYASHLGDRYQMHLLYQNYNHKAAESGGITNDDYITHPEHFEDSYSTDEIPTILSSNWNRNSHQHLFLTHRYSMGFYRKVPMTEEEIKAKQFAEASAKENAKQKGTGDEDDKPAPEGRPDNAKIASQPAPGKELPADSLSLAMESGILPAADSLAAASGRITVDSKAMADSLMAAEAATDSADMYMKREFVPVTSFIHTLDVSSHRRIYQAYAAPSGLYADTLFSKDPVKGYANDSIYDQTKYFNVRNTLALALLEGFNKYAPAGLKAFISHDLRRFDMPDMADADSTYLRRWTEHNVSVGGQLVKAQGSTLHYDLLAEAWLAGEDAGQLKLDAQADLNFSLFGDTLRLDARGHLHRLNPVFVQRHYHSKHLWWDNSLDKETRTHIEGTLSYEKTNTRLRVAVDEILNYTYLGMSYTAANESYSGLTARFYQHSKALSVLTAQIDQRLRLGPLHWDNVLTYQTTSDKDVLPLPELNLFTNLYLQFTVAHVLRVELGASATWFSKYYAPDFLPQLNQYAVQQNEDSRIELGNFPFVDAYANLHLKHARFFVMMNNAMGKNFDRRSFLTPHYPTNRSVLYMGVSWNFFN